MNRIDTKPIIYIAVGAYQLLGVREKIKAKIEAMMQQNLQVLCLFFCNDIDQEIKEGNVCYIPFKFEGKIPSFWRGRFFWRYQEFYVRREKFKIIKREIKQLSNFNGIIFRYISADLNLLLFAIAHFKTIVFEHNILELEELKLLPENSVNRYYFCGEKIFGSSVRFCAKGLISVTKQIAAHERSRTLNIVPSFVISNGINCETFPLANIPKYSSGKLNVMFSSGYANPVHGLDILLKSVETAKDVQVHLVGDFIWSDFKENPNVIVHGRLEGLAYQKVFELCHIAVSPLAIYRKNLIEAASLKNREYACRGIPFILAHKDQDFEDEMITPFIYRIETHDQYIINFEEVKGFLKTLHELNYSKMRIYAEERLSYLSKANSYKSVIQKLFK